MPYGKPKMYGKPKSAGLKALAAKNKNLEYVGPKMSGGGPKKVGSQERYNDSPFNYKAQVMMADMPMMYGAGKPKSTGDDPDTENKKKKISEAEYVDRELTKLMKKQKLTADETLAATKNFKQVYKQQNLGN